MKLVLISVEVEYGEQLSLKDEFKSFKTKTSIQIENIVTDFHIISFTLAAIQDIHCSIQSCDDH